MVKIHNLGFPRIGPQRELKFALEAYWRGEIDVNNLAKTAQNIRQANWQAQQELDLIPVGDFSLYDHVLDTSQMFNNLPKRIDNSLSPAIQYFLTARGRVAESKITDSVGAAEMTKWFNSNYHYLVPEFDSETTFSLNADQLLAQLAEAHQLGHTAKPVILGPVSYLWLGKTKDDTSKLSLLTDLLHCYENLLIKLAAAGAEWVQIDEPILALELDTYWQQALEQSYFALQKTPISILLATYFGPLRENLQLACDLPTAGLHIDAVNARDEVIKVIDWFPGHKILSLGVIDGRNIWKTDLNRQLDWLEPIQQRLKDRLWLAPSCSLLHVPVDLNAETELEPELKTWLAFACQKLEELQILATALNHGRNCVALALEQNAVAIASRHRSVKVHNPTVQQQLSLVDESWSQRQAPYTERIEIQKTRFNLPLYPLTTIGSFPQTASIRQARQQYRAGKIDTAGYQQLIKQEIQYAIREQEKIGLDVLVHGEAERNDMVEYFGEQLEGFAFTRFGWVQSYGSRCVKPPIIYGDISRSQAMTVEWIRYAQSLTKKPVKGMLTGPVTMLNWSFVRDDQTREETCLQLALAIREEVLDLEHAGVGIIQIDEAALREGIPLRKSEWSHYLEWAVNCFRISANGVSNKTQIHTHMCYSEFNDIITAIADMDADVITIETSRSDMELLDVFNEFAYPNEIGPGVYDIHSPNIPDQTQIVDLLQKAAKRIPADRLWVNPDCGLKTRQWDEVKPALQAMVSAAFLLREQAA